MMKSISGAAFLLFTILLTACNKREAFPDFTFTPPGGIDSMPVQYGTPFAGVVDRRDAVIYQVNIRPFSAAGNLAGVTARLDAIKDLGANVVYLMPIYPIGSVNGINSPYATKDYTSVNPEFGNLDDLRNLVDAAHAKGMSVILDFVANHTAWDHPWITEHKDWYAQDASGNIVSPAGYNDVAQLNFNNAFMRQAMIRNMKYWVYKANIDGYRFDFADNVPVDFWRAAVDTLRNITSHKLLLLAEGARSANFSAGFDYNFGFSFFGNMKNVFNGQPAQAVDALNLSEYTGATGTQQVVRYITNHDVNSSDGTPQELFRGVSGSMAAFVVAAYMKGVPMVYNGQEVGTPFRLTFPFTSAKIDWSLNPAVTAEYKRVLNFRNSSNAIRRGTLVSHTTNDVVAFTKEAGAEKVLVLSNLRNATVSFAVPQPLQNIGWKNAFTNADVAVGTTVSLAPYQYMVLKNN